MNRYSKSSKNNLSQCHIDLQLICHELLKIFDHSVICGHRSEEDQEKAFNKGNSKVHYPNSKHNSIPALAVDIIPYPIDWKDINNFSYMGGLFLGIAYILKENKIITHDIRWGGHWKRLKDYPHFELIEV